MKYYLLFVVEIQNEEKYYLCKILNFHKFPWLFIFWTENCGGLIEKFWGLAVLRGAWRSFPRILHNLGRFLEENN